MLRLSLCLVDGAAYGSRDALRGVPRGEDRTVGGRRLGGDGRDTTQEHSLATHLPQVRRAQRVRRAPADQDLPRRRRGLHRNHGADRRAGDHELAVRRPDQEHVEEVAVDPDRHPQVHPLTQDVESAGGPQVPPHGEGRTARTRLVLGSREEEEQGVPAELQQLGAIGVGQGQEADEALVDDGSEFLGSDLALFGQSLGELGETRDVDEDQTALDRPVVQLGCGGLPVHDQARQVRHEEVRGHSLHVIRRKDLGDGPWSGPSRHGHQPSGLEPTRPRLRTSLGRGRRSRQGVRRTPHFGVPLTTDGPRSGRHR